MVDSALSIPEAALKLGVSADTVRRRVKSGQLQAVREQHGRNHQWLINLSEYAAAASLPDYSARLSQHEVGPASEVNGPSADTLSSLRSQVSDLRASLEMAKSELEARRAEVGRLLALLERDSTAR